MGGPMQMRRRGEEGFSLIETMMGATIGALLIAIVVVTIRNVQRQEKKVELRLGKQHVLSWIKRNIDCQNLASSCTPNQLVAVPRSNGGDLLRNDGSSKLGLWTMRAMCTSSEGGFDVQIGVFDRNQQPILDPVTRKALDFNHRNSTLTKKSDLCSDVQTATIQRTDFFIGPSTVCTSHSHQGCLPSDPSGCPSGSVSVGVIRDDYGGHDHSAYPNDGYGSTFYRLCEPE